MRSTMPIQTRIKTFHHGEVMPMKRKRGGQPGNKNAVGNKGGAPYGNINAWKHGGYAVAQMQRGITRYTLNKMLDEMTPEQIRILRDR